MVTSHNIDESQMGNRGSKSKLYLKRKRPTIHKVELRKATSQLINFVKEQRVDDS